MVCTTTDPFRCIGTFPSLAACEAACAADSACAIMTYSAGTQNCWTRTDNLWQLTDGSGVTAGCDPARVPGCGPAPPPYNGSLSLDIGTATLFRSHPLHPGVALDFWGSGDPTYGIKWAKSGILTIDLTSPRLLALASSLAPALLRLGGSPEDSIVFDVDGTCTPGGEGPEAAVAAGYYCSQVHPYVYGCLTPSRWEQLLAFGAATGLRIALGLNGCYGRNSSTTPMDFTNIRALLEATVVSPNIGALYGFELSNEVAGSTITPATWSADAATLHGMLASIWSAHGLPTPPLVGPDQGGVSLITEIVATVPAGTLTALTYHQYVQCVATPGSWSVLQTSCLEQLDTAAVSYVAAAAAQPGLAVWSGEGADHSGGGIANLTDTFRSSFYYAWQLGALPSNGVELAARQCLSGGDYDLLSHVNGSFLPNPDYIIVWLFHTLIGGNASAYSAVTSVPTNLTGVRAFAFSASPATGGSLALLILNLNAQNAFPVTLTGAAAGRARTEYHLTGDVALEYGTVSCNGIPLTLDAANALPPWRSLGQPAAAGSPVALAPASIVFMTM